MEENCFICGRKKCCLYNWSFNEYFGIIREEEKVKLCDKCFNKVESLLDITIDDRISDIIIRGLRKI